MKTFSHHREHILVIKHGALGDIILATGPFAAIRAHHPHAHITLLTTQAYAGLFKGAPYFDDIWIDTRPKLWQIGRLVALIRLLHTHRFHWVYDLQTSRRSTDYYHLFPHPKPFISGLHPKASHRHHTPERTRLHTIDRQKQQLALAGIYQVPPPDVSWLMDDRMSGLPDDWNQIIQSSNHPIILLVPGGSAHRPAKRWPAEHFIALANAVIDKGFTPVLIGAAAEADLLRLIASSHHRIIDLCNRTTLPQIADLARQALYAVGNDTGPMHLIAAAGCPCTVLFNTTESNPALCAPRGEKVTIAEASDLSKILPHSILQGFPPLFT